eukprot:3197964-Lingulodinium_polyedra.AAC.1
MACATAPTVPIGSGARPPLSLATLRRPPVSRWDSRPRVGWAARGRRRPRPPLLRVPPPLPL